MNYDSRSTWDSGLDAGSIPACSTIYLGVRQLVDGVIWGHEAVGSSPTTQTI